MAKPVEKPAPVAKPVEKPTPSTLSPRLAPESSPRIGSSMSPKKESSPSSCRTPRGRLSGLIDHSEPEAPLRASPSLDDDLDTHDSFVRKLRLRPSKIAVDSHGPELSARSTAKSLVQGSSESEALDDIIIPGQTGNDESSDIM